MEIITKDKFLYMLRWSLESAPIVSDELNEKIEEFHSELSSEKSLKGEKYIASLDQKVADYLYSIYHFLYFSDDEKIYGVNGEYKVYLIDATDRKAHLDIF